MLHSLSRFPQLSGENSEEQNAGCLQWWPMLGADVVVLRVILVFVAPELLSEIL